MDTLPCVFTVTEGWKKMRLAGSPQCLRGEVLTCDFNPRILNEFALRNVSAHACVSQVYAPQTKVLEGGTKDEIRIFD
jgi:hypothetical protein